MACTLFYSKDKKGDRKWGESLSERTVRVRNTRVARLSGKTNFTTLHTANNKLW